MSVQKISLNTLLALGIIILGVRLNVINLFSVAMPYWDDWGIGGLLYNYQTIGLTFQGLIQDVNQHRQVFGKLLAIVLFELNHHQWDTQLMMLANSVIWVVSGLFLMNIARSHNHQINPTPIILLILVLWSYPISLVNTVWGVQSHVYFMTLFAVIGCWYACETPFSKRWFFGIFCLFAGGLTLAGGSFIGISVAGVFSFLACFDTKKRRNHLYTALFSALGGLFGILLILIQPGTSSFIENLNSIDAFITFAKTMSWPVRRQIWPFFLFLTPIIVLLLNVIKTKGVNSRLTPFILSIYGFIIMIAIAIAAARSADGAGPARRYSDFLALAFVASSFALLLIQQEHYKLHRLVKQTLIALWGLAILLAIPLRLETTQFTIDDRAIINPLQEKYVRRFINTHVDSNLTGKIHRHIPFPRANSLAKYLKNYQEVDILPYSLQKLEDLTYNPELPAEQLQQPTFIRNGMLLPITNQSIAEGWYRENVMGSFYPKFGGVQNTGTYESNTFRINRSYAMIPVIGDAGHPDMSLKLVDVLNGTEVIVNPPFNNTDFIEEWREVHINIKRGYYKIVAEDNSETRWFGFAAPRSVGRLSHFTQKTLNSSHVMWLSGIALLCFSYRKKIIHSVTNSDSKNTTYGL